MNKNTPGHKYYRTEEDMARDLSLILALSVSLKAKHDNIDSVLWKWTERFGKYGGCKQYSPAAYKHYRLYGNKDLRHDHAIPRNVLNKMFVEKLPLSASQILKLLRKFCVAVVITKKEDSRFGKVGLTKKMPSRWNWKNPYARYKAVGIKVVKGRLSRRELSPSSK